MFERDRTLINPHFLIHLSSDSIKRVDQALVKSSGAVKSITTLNGQSVITIFPWNNGVEVIMSWRKMGEKTYLQVKLPVNSIISPPMFQDFSSASTMSEDVAVKFHPASYEINRFLKVADQPKHLLVVELYRVGKIERGDVNPKHLLETFTVNEEDGVFKVTHQPIAVTPLEEDDDGPIEIDLTNFEMPPQQ